MAHSKHPLHLASSHADTATAAPFTGIIWAYRFAEDCSAEVIPNDRGRRSPARREGAWIWVHLALADNRCRGWIMQHAPLAEMGRETLTSPDKHLRLDVIGEEVVGVVPTCTKVSRRRATISSCCALS